MSRDIGTRLVQLDNVATFEKRFCGVALLGCCDGLGETEKRRKVRTRGGREVDVEKVVELRMKHRRDKGRTIGTHFQLRTAVTNGARRRTL